MIALIATEFVGSESTQPGIGVKLASTLYVGRSGYDTTTASCSASRRLRGVRCTLTLPIEQLAQAPLPAMPP